jgi:LicD family
MNGMPPMPSHPSPAPDQRALQTLLPALGYFGATHSDCLDLQWTGTVRGMRATIPEDGGPHILNLTGLELHGRDGCNALDPDLDLCGVETTQSSVYEDDPRFGPGHLLRGGDIHTQSESSPWWQATWPQETQITRIRLFNRGDHWGIRARTLCIELLVGDRWQQVHCPGSGEQLLGTLQACSAVTGSICLDADPRRTRDTLLEQLADKLLCADTALHSVAWRRILPLVDIWSPHALTDPETTVLAAWMTQDSGLHLLLPIAKKLRTPQAILQLQDRINAVAQVHQLGHYVITRHGIHHSYLVQHKALFLAGAEKLIQTLQALQYQPMLAYGTLLGAVRDQSLIPHDDDMDLMLVSRATDRPAVEREMTALAEQLRATGYRVVQLLPESLNMRVGDPSLGVEFDLFPCWRGHGDTLFLHMEKMHIRTIPEHIVHPPATVTLHGRTLPAPADPRAFLTERYGPAWTTPNQFFEWPWPLSATP